MKKSIRRMLALTSGLAALAATAVPTAAAHGPDTGRATASQLRAADAAVLAADIAGTAWHTDTKTGKLVVTADSTVSEADLTTLKKASPAGTVEITRTPGAFSTLRAGGETIYSVQPSGRRCTLGFNVMRGGKAHALTAGHCTSTVSLWDIGPSVAGTFPGSDFGLIEHSNPAEADGRVYLYNGTYRDITGAANPFVGQLVQRSGSTTGMHGGSVTALNATVNYGADGIVTGLIKTNVCAEPGDSGGPLFSNSTALGLLSGGSGNCSFGGITYYQPVVEALNAYGASII